MDKIVEALVKELDPQAEVVRNPHGFKGILLVKPGAYSRDELVQLFEKHVLEAEKIIPIDVVTQASLEALCESMQDIVIEKIKPNETFAVRTTRRGRHSFTSIDVNVVLGDCIRRFTGASVNLKYPDKIVLVEIIQDDAYVSILPGSFEYHKYAPEKKGLVKLFRRIAVVQVPYLGPINAVAEMGKRIGREVQNFEVKELVIAPIGCVDAYQLYKFIEAVYEGIESRYKVQERSYSRKPYRVEVYVMDLYQLVRERAGEVIIVFEPEGKYIMDVRRELADLVLKSGKRVNLLFGSREGIPTGIYKHADLVIDIAPGVTISTDYAAAAGLIALTTAIYNEYRGMGEDESGDLGRGEGRETQAYN